MFVLVCFVDVVGGIDDSVVICVSCVEVRPVVPSVIHTPDVRGIVGFGPVPFKVEKVVVVDVVVYFQQLVFLVNLSCPNVVSNDLVIGRSFAHIYPPPELFKSVTEY